MLAFLLDRLRPVASVHTVVATSDLPADDPVADVASSCGVAVIRGPEQDVLARYALAIAAYPAETVVRITGDCPLTDPAVVDAAIRRHHQTNADYTSNTLVRTFPDGLDVEVIATRALLEAAAEATDAVEREHVTPFVYRRPRRYRLAVLRHPELLGDERWTVDTAADLDFVRSVVDHFGDRRDFGLDEVVAIVGRRHRAGHRELRVADAEGEPAVRAWEVLEGDRSAGTVRMEVDDAVGTVVVDTAAPIEQVTELLMGQLAADCQVREVRISQAGLVVATAGLDPAGHALRWRSRVTLRAATMDDVERLWHWRNDDLTRRNSVSTDEVPWEDHARWLENALGRLDRHLFIAEEDGVPVGQVRLDTLPDGWEVSITIAPEARGRRLAVALLNAVGTNVTGALHAHVKPDNSSSLRAFEAAGYGATGDEMRDGTLLIHLLRA